jgi:hypothetical protein
MPRLGQRNDDRIDTFLKLPSATRAELESAIGHNGIKSLTDAVVAAAKLLAKQIKKQRPASQSPPQDRS